MEFPNRDMRYAGRCIPIGEAINSKILWMRVAAHAARELGLTNVVALIEHAGADQWATWYGTNETRIANTPFDRIPVGCVELP